jgi:hypothetical protein
MEVVDPKTGKTCYYNRLTETASNTKPVAVNTGDGQDTVGTTPQHLDMLIPFDKFTRYMERKKHLAMNNTPEWSVDMDQSSGKIYYKNNVSGEVRWNLPQSLDTLGGCVSMVHLKANQNLIRDFPSSICRMVKLEVLEAKNNYIGEVSGEKWRRRGEKGRRKERQGGGAKTTGFAQRYVRHSNFFSPNPLSPAPFARHLRSSPRNLGTLTSSRH